jgi:DNA-binding CsgD family transcriptional regulator
MDAPQFFPKEFQSKEADTLSSDSDLAFLDRAQCVFLALGRGGELLQLNTFGAILLGVNQKVILGDNWFDSFLPGTHRQQSHKMYRLFMSEKGPGRSNYRYPVILGDGSRKEILWFHTVIVGGSGERRSSLLIGQMEKASWGVRDTQTLPGSSGPNDRTYLLSPKERVIAEQICQGKTSRDISGDLLISRLTVDRHRNNMRKKLKVPHELRLSEYLKLYL